MRAVSGPAASAAAAPASAGPHYFVPGQGWVPVDLAERAGTAPEAPAGEPGSSTRGANAGSPALGGAGADPAPNPGQETGRQGTRASAGGAAQAGAAGAAAGDASRPAGGANPENLSSNDRGGWGPGGGGGAEAASSAQPAGAGVGSGETDSKAGTPSAEPAAETAAGAAPEGGVEQRGTAAAGAAAGATAGGATHARERADAVPGAGQARHSPHYDQARQPDREARASPALPDVAAAEVDLPEHWVDPRVALTLPPGADVASLRHRATVAMRAAQVVLGLGFWNMASRACDELGQEGRLLCVAGSCGGIGLAHMHSCIWAVCQSTEI